MELSSKDGIKILFHGITNGIPKEETASIEIRYWK
jgi:hypothetical protein